MAWFNAKQALAAAVAVLLPVAAQAVVIGGYTSQTNTDAENGVAPPTSTIPYYNNVGSLNGASGIYLGNDWVLTADHVGEGTITLNGVAYAPSGGEIRLTNPSDDSPTDLVLFQLASNPGLPTLTLASSSPVVGTLFYNVGYGYDRDTAIEYFGYDSSTSSYYQTTASNAVVAGYGYSAPGLKTWGSNVVQNVSTTAVPTSLTVINTNQGYGNVTVFAGQFGQNSDQIDPGDSGGAAFDSAGDLVGMNDALGEYDNQPANTVLFGNMSYMADIATYAPQIVAITGIPEPSTAGGVVILAAVMSGLRHRGKMQATRGMVG